MQSASSRYKLTLSITSLVRTVVSFAELVLMVRIILDFLKASSDALFVQWINRATDPMLWPFVGTFSPYELKGGYVIQLHEVLAFLFYAFVGYLFFHGITMLGAHRSIFRKGKLEDYR